MKTLLIANRGEIACRIIRTAQRMGLRTVALYADSDANAPHVRAATSAMPLGPDSARPWLDGARIVALARESGADAVHPGYGFLSENADFAHQVTSAGLVFVGPPSAAIRAMALKDAAKALMKKAGVPVTPGYQGMDQSLVRLERAAERIGIPLLIKAVAGGGGKGMRIVESAEDFQPALMAAQREAEASFGNPSVLLEKYVARARHVEVQVFADGRGNVVHLGTRDCSLQRRHQKLIEEAPAPGLSPRLTHLLSVAAVTAATAIQYQNAGTIEFLLDLDSPDKHGDPAFYFMEMNTRLQVEHPVTEAITGLDLVEWQLRVARGEPLPLAQSEIPFQGHAVEARLCAEDVETGFLPSTGTIGRVRFPSGLRIDTGIESGSRIGLDYDPLIAKLIAHAPTREQALETLTDGLDQTIITGVRTNRALLARLTSHVSYIEEDFDTGFLETQKSSLKPPETLPESVPNLAALGLLRSQTRPDSPQTDPFQTPFRLNMPLEAPVRLWFNDTLHSLAIPLPPSSLDAHVHITPQHVEIRQNGQTYTLSRHPPQRASTGTISGQIRAPMPGRVLSLDVLPGESVKKGQQLLVLEAMKMEHPLKAPADGIVTAVHTAAGDIVAEAMLLIEIKG